jgi:hypothetical protein
MRDYWKPSARSRKNRELAELMNLASSALEAEDRRIARSVETSRNDATAPSRQHASREVGRGLSYPLYETTLVYFVWRGWMAAGKPAALDWTAAQLAGKDRRLAKGARGKLYDLVVFGSGRQPGFVFEAKRWAYSPGAMKEALRRDARKLPHDLPDGMPKLARAQKYVLLFSHQALKADRCGELDELCEVAGLPV